MEIHKELMNLDFTLCSSIVLATIIPKSVVGLDIIHFLNYQQLLIKQTITAIVCSILTEVKES